MSYKVDFATFCHAGDAHRLHAPGQLIRQIRANNYLFNTAIVVYQGINATDYQMDDFYSPEVNECCKTNWSIPVTDIDQVLRYFNIDLDKGQYVSKTDQAHHWKHHVVNHLTAIQVSTEITKADYIVFADNDCWMVEQPEGKSWIDEGIRLLLADPTIFIVSPNDGEPSRYTRRFSQQMFIARVDEFRSADFNQPNWDGNVNIPGAPMPEYWAMLEGRMELHCRITGQYRYVLGPEYRYWHHNRLNEQGLFELDRRKY